MYPQKRGKEGSGTFCKIRQNQLEIETQIAPQLQLRSKQEDNTSKRYTLVLTMLMKAGL